MAASEPVLAAYRALHGLTVQLRDATRSELWDEAQALMEEQSRIVAALSGLASPLDSLSPQQLREVESLLQETDQANREALSRAEAWRNEVGGIVGEIGAAQVNSNRLARAYRG